MRPETFTTWAVGRAVDLVNLYAERGDSVTQHDLHTLLHEYDFPEDDLDVRAFGRLARDLRGTFRDPGHEVRVQRLNHLLDRAQPLPRLAEHDEHGPHFHYIVAGSAIDHISSALLMAVATVVVDRGVERFGWCAAPGCDRLFYDRSRNRSQRFCSRSCATRVNVRAHRARQ